MRTQGLDVTQYVYSILFGLGIVIWNNIAIKIYTLCGNFRKPADDSF